MGTVTNPCARFASSSNADNVTAVLCAIASMTFALYVVNAKPLPEYIYDDRRGSILCLVQVIQVTIGVTGGAALIYWICRSHYSLGSFKLVCTHYATGLLYFGWIFVV